MATEARASGIRPSRQRRHFPINHLTGGLARHQARSASIRWPATPTTPIDMPPSQLLLVALVSAMLLWQPAGAADYAVGGDGSNAWDTGTNYATWAQAHSFVAGDALLFNYVKSQHNVYEVTEAAYRSCDATAPGAVLATYDTGFDRVVLPDAKTYWFICEVPNHCVGGMKLAVNVSGAGAPGGSPPAIYLPPPSPSAASQSWTASWAGLVLLGVAHVLVNRAG